MNTKMSTPQGPTGLDNIGNTCFANSVIQCLMHTKEISEIFESIKGANQLKRDEHSQNNKLASPIQTTIRSWRQKKGSLDLTKLDKFWWTYCAMQEIVDICSKAGSEPITPISLYQIINKVFGEGLAFGLQQDAHEFLIMLLHYLQDSEWIKHNQNERQEDDYEFDIKTTPCVDFSMPEIFEGSFTSRITWNQWNYNTESSQKFQDVWLVSWSVHFQNLF